MINIRTIKIKNQAYYRADFRYAPTGFNNTDWEQKSDELVAAGLLPKTKQLTINKSKMTKKEVREKCAALINNVDDHDMSKDILMVKDLFANTTDPKTFTDGEFKNINSIEDFLDIHMYPKCMPLNNDYGFIWLSSDEKDKYGSLILKQEGITNENYWERAGADIFELLNFITINN